MSGLVTNSHDDWTRDICLMEGEWVGVERRVRARVAAWEPEIEALAAEENRLREKGLWVHGRDEYLGVLGLEGDERTHSRVIRWLLDPCAHHGLGTRVLSGVLDATLPCELDPTCLSTLGSARVTCEFPRGGAFIDIHVAAPGLTLVIENKVGAPESDRQCDSYFELFRDEPGARFIFLTPTGYRPDSASGPAIAAFRPLAYRQIRRILSEALAATPTGARGRSIAEDYLRTLDREFR